MILLSNNPATASTTWPKQKPSGDSLHSRPFGILAQDSIALSAVYKSNLIRFGEREQPTAHITPAFAKALGNIVTRLGHEAPRVTVAQVLYSAAASLDHGGSEADAITAMRLASWQATGYTSSPQRNGNIGAVYLAQIRMLTMQPIPTGKKHNAVTGKKLWFEQQPASMLQREARNALAALDKPSSQIPAISSNQALGTISLGPRFIDAVAYAAELHRSQIRSDTKAPYVSHLLAVASYILLNGGDEDTAIAGLLHDAVEDQGGSKTLQQIQQKFGQKVAGIIQDCTQPNVKDWYQSKRGYIEHLEHVQHPESYLVVGADKLHNLQCLTRSVQENGENAWKYFWKGKNDQIWFYQAAIHQLEKHSGLTPLNLAVKNELQILKRLVFRSEAQSAAQAALAENPLYKTLTHIVQTVSPPYAMIRDKKDVPQPQLSPERLALHEKIYDQVLANQRQQHPTPKTVHMVTGLLGSGKTSKIIPALVARDRALVVDNDLLRSELPEYSLPLDDPRIADLNLPKKNGLAATALHRESGIMCNTLLDRIIAENRSFVITHNGTNYEMDLAFLRQLKAKGYRVFLHHVEIPPNMAIKRANKRFFEKGRFIPPYLIANLNTLPTDNFLALKKQASKEDLLDGYAWYYNGVPDGDAPILVESWERPK